MLRVQSERWEYSCSEYELSQFTYGVTLGYEYNEANAVETSFFFA